MALPNSGDLQTLDYSYSGLPDGDVPAKAAIVTTTMDWSYSGLPFVTNPAPRGPLHLMTWCGVPAANIQTINGVDLANVASIDGVA